MNAKISQLNKQIKNGAEFEEGSYENIVVEIDKTSKQISDIKNDIKAKQANLYTKTENKIKNLSEQEIKELLIKKWIDPICTGINDLSIKSIKSLKKDLQILAKKYEITLTDLDQQIKDTEDELSHMIDELTGNELDIEGLKQFQQVVLRGNKNEK
mgnify:CR=1 FL=1